MNKKIIFTEHAKARAHERLLPSFDHLSLIFEVELKNIFFQSRQMYSTDNDKLTFETIYKNKKIKFICSESKKEIIVQTIIVN